jgi:hypothetical protein
LKINETDFHIPTVATTTGMNEHPPKTGRLRGTHSEGKVDQLLQIDLKQLPLWLYRLAFGTQRFSPVFRLFANHYREILALQSSQIIRFGRGFAGFPGTTI